MHLAPLLLLLGCPDPGPPGVDPTKATSVELPDLDPNALANVYVLNLQPTPQSEDEGPKSHSLECPDAGGWTMQTVGTRFCRFEQDTGSRQDLYDALAGAGYDVTDPHVLDADMAIVMPLGALDAPMQPLVEDRFRQNLIAPNVAPTGSSQQVRLVVLDSAIDGDTNGSDDFLRLNASSPAGAHHGHAVLNIARSAACPGGTCSPNLTLQSIQSLNYQSLSAGAGTTGAVFGSLMELATGIHQAVNQARDAEEQLVINLSLGWIDTFGGMGPPHRWPAGVDAVYDALHEARCYGAVVLAAEGNVQGTLGAARVLPSAWGPHGAAFRRVPLPTPPGPCDNPGAPMVYSVGGVTGNAMRLAVTLPNSDPDLLALGEHAIVLDVDNQRTNVMAGTSVSTAVASAWVANETIASGKPPQDVIGKVATPPGSPPYSVRPCDLTGASCASPPPWTGSTGLTLTSPNPAVTSGCTSGSTCLEDTNAGPLVVAGNKVGPQPDDPTCPFCNLEVLPSAGVAPVFLSEVSNEFAQGQLIVHLNTGDELVFELGPLGAGATVSSPVLQEFEVPDLMGVTGIESARMVAVEPITDVARVQEVILLP